MLYMIKNSSLCNFEFQNLKANVPSNHSDHVIFYKGIWRKATQFVTNNQTKYGSQKVTKRYLSTL